VNKQGVERLRRGGVAASERVCAETARLLGLTPLQVLPSSTGVIWLGLARRRNVRGSPGSRFCAGAPVPCCRRGRHRDDGSLSQGSLRRGGAPDAIVGIAKGAGMIEPTWQRCSFTC